MKRHQNNQGQGTLEYMIMLTGVIAVLIVFMNPRGGIFQQKFNETLAISTNSMVQTVNFLTGRNP